MALGTSMNMDLGLVEALIDAPVPRHSVGVVIGRSGEMIKKIQNDAGVRIQFKQGEGWAPPWFRHWCCPPALAGPQCLQRFGTQFFSVAFLELVSLRLLS